MKTTGTIVQCNKILKVFSRIVARVETCILSTVTTVITVAADNIHTMFFTSHHIPFSVPDDAALALLLQ